MKRALLGCFLFALACGKPAVKPAPVAEARKPPELVIIEDDYPTALATARREHRPLFVDVWAPWCHTCLSFRAYVLRDPSLSRLAPKYVWAAINSEKPNNAAFVAKYPIESWPTLMVIDPVTEKPLLKWLGAANVEELTMLLDDVAGSQSAPNVSAAWIEGNRAAAESRTEEAILAYRNALDAKPDRARRARIVDALIAQVSKLDKQACAKLAREELPHLVPGTSRANVALTGFECARTTEPADREALANVLTTIVIDPADPILPDDRSALYEVLIEYRKSLGDAKGAKTLARTWATYVDGEAAKATTPSARVVFDAHRMTAYLELGEPGPALLLLEQSEKDFPSDYNPPARLARVHLAMGHLPEARAAIGRALDRAYGPRTLRLLALKADIAHAAGDAVTERQALDAAITLGSSLGSGSLSRGSAKLLEELKQRRAALATP